MPQRQIILAHLTLGELTLAQIAPIAAAAGYTAANVRMWGLADVDGTILGEHPQRLREVMRIFADVGLATFDATAVILQPDFQIDRFRPGLALAAEIGARRVLAICRDDEVARGADNFAKVAEAAGALGLAVDLEFMVFAAVKTLPEAVRFVAHSGRDNVGVVLDTTHFIRSGGTVEDIRRADPKYLTWMQLADGLVEHPDVIVEARTERLLPGEGAFPLGEILRTMPADATISVEIPSRSRLEAGVGADDWARRAMAATRRVLDAATPG